MFILLTKRRILFAILICGILTATGIVMSYSPAFISAFSVQDGMPVTVVLDPGHGGEDGGAMSPDGVEEAHLNLEVSLRLRDLLRFSGQHVVMTREEDVSTCDETVTGTRARKVSDLKNRVLLVNATPGAVLMSIHQNSLPSSSATHGAQVFWNQEEGAQLLAESIQTALNESINTEREKQAKPIPQTIYLTKHITAPGVIVECGFLSNEEDTIKLQQPEHQQKLTVAIAAGFLSCGAAEEGSVQMRS